LGWVQIPPAAPLQDLLNYDNGSAFAVVQNLKFGRREPTLLCVARKLCYLARNRTKAH
jgi:hypothetical protein